MVRIKVACKDVSKIPRKMMFEMKERIYLVQFNNEGKSGLREYDGVMMKWVMT
jgi:hypothetical protein